LGNRWREVKEMDIRQLVTMSVGFASSLHTFGRLFSRNALAGWGKKEEKPRRIFPASFLKIYYGCCCCWPLSGRFRVIKCLTLF